jgi:peptide/nickel transport system permease protein
MTTHASRSLGRLARNRSAVAGASVLGTLALIATFADLIAGTAPLVAVGHRGVEFFPGVAHRAEYAELDADQIRKRFEGAKAIYPLVRADPYARSSEGPKARSSIRHPLGTDLEGRDVFARLVHGTRPAIGTSLAAIVMSAILGIAIGLSVGASRNVWSARLMRVVEAVDTLPTIILIAVLGAIHGPVSAAAVALGIGLVRWAEVARLVRAEALRANTEDYVMAARALGATPLRIMAFHILPNALGPVFASAASGVATVALVETSASFLDLRAGTDVVSWGEMLAEAARSPRTLPLLVAPLTMLFVTVVASHLLAEGLRQATDPRAPAPQRSSKGAVGTESIDLPARSS